MKGVMLPTTNSVMRSLLQASVIESHKAESSQGRRQSKELERKEAYNQERHEGTGVRVLTLGIRKEKRQSAY